MKVYKALRVMEKQKASDPRYSNAIKQLVEYLYQLRENKSQTNLSKLSKYDFETSSAFTGVGSMLNHFGREGALTKVNLDKLPSDQHRSGA